MNREYVWRHHYRTRVENEHRALQNHPCVASSGSCGLAELEIQSSSSSPPPSLSMHKQVWMQITRSLAISQPRTPINIFASPAYSPENGCRNRTCKFMVSTPLHSASSTTLLRCYYKQHRVSTKILFQWFQRGFAIHFHRWARRIRHDFPAEAVPLVFGGRDFWSTAGIPSPGSFYRAPWPKVRSDNSFVERDCGAITR